MIVIRNFNNIKEELQNSCLALGNFDGFHLGHKEILDFTKNLAKKNQRKSALLTFEPHPRHFFNKNDPNKNVRIYSLSQKLEILKKEKLVDIIFLIHFNEELANLSAADFIKNILVDRLKVNYIVVGYDFSFGKNRVGNADLLQELAPKYDYNFNQIEAKTNEDQEIYSSTNIRKLIESGEIAKASKILGRIYEIKGIVIKGQQNGRKIGFRTANILPKFHIIKPKFGVYQSITQINGKNYKSITNFGIKPTFLGKTEVFETHIFDFEQDIYNQPIKVQLLDFIRPEMKFNNVEELTTQIKQDCKNVKNA